MNHSPYFKDRVQAGKELAKRLTAYQGKDVVVCALPRGGVVIGIEVARALRAPLDLAIARKIGAPHHEEFAIAAITEDGDMVADEQEVTNVDPAWFKKACQEQRDEAKRRRKAYLGKRTPIPIEGKITIIVDDGIATGLTMRAILKEMRRRHPATIIVAVPVAPPEAIELLQKEADDVVVLLPELPDGAVGAAYESFPQVTDNEVREIIKTAA